MNYQKVIHVGRLTRDPELEYKESGGEPFALVRMGLAINRPKRNKEAEDVADFFEWSATGRTAENIANYFKKGDEILLEGSAVYRTWETDDGQKRSMTSFRAYRFEFGQKSKKNQQNERNGGGSDGIDVDEEDFDEIPF